MKATRREILALAAIGALGAWPASAETASQPDEAPAGSNQADFDQVWELVRDRFYDPHLNGLDWQEERARFRPQAASARSRKTRPPSSTPCWRSSAPLTPITTRLRIRPITSSRIFSRARSSIAASSGSSRGGSVLSGNRRVHRGRRSGPHIRNRGDRGRARACGRRSLGDEILSADDRPFRPVELFPRQGRSRRLA